MNPSPTLELDRRDFVKTLSFAGLGLASGLPSLEAATPNPRTRIAIVGTGNRGRFYQDAIEGPYRRQTELVALCDTNPGRIELARNRSVRAKREVPVGYLAEDFSRMVAETKPQVILVTAVDQFHDDYIVRAMELGCEVITEKPLATNEEKCKKILEARERTGKKCRVTFNYRYAPARSQVKELLMQGAIGDILTVDFHWMLDTRHGADYFRRWHSEKVQSGGLGVHKASHHFDLVNWWLSAIPQNVQARGRRDYYTPGHSLRLGLKQLHKRCRGCTEAQACAFLLDLEADPELKELYLDNEHHDEYHRDRCVFREGITIEDSLSAIVGYDTGATLNYSLTAYGAWEGYTIAFNGTAGRLEHGLVESLAGQPTHEVTTRLIPLRGSPERPRTPSVSSGHSGGDKLLLEELFLPGRPEDPLKRAADERSGTLAALVGIAANKSLATGKPVLLTELLEKLPRPDYTPMPDRKAKVPMPPA